VYDVAVVGSGGFLGKAIARDLEDRGASVGCFTRRAPLVMGEELAAQARVVVWAAATITPAVAAAEPLHVADDIAKFRTFVALAERCAAPPRVILLSSGGTVYGAPSAPPFTEADEPHPVNAYGAAKLVIEDVLRTSALPHHVLRIANPYGPGQAGRGGQGVLGAWLTAAARDDEIVVFGNAIRDYVYIDDTVRAVALAIDNPGAPEVINIGSGTGTDLVSLLETVHAAVAPRELRVRHEGPRAVDPPAAWLDVSLADERLGWRASTPLTDGVARMWETIRT
jgi:UDP-glucose 4-epimerase